MEHSNIQNGPSESLCLALISLTVQHLINLEQQKWHRPGTVDPLVMTRLAMAIDYHKN